MKSLVTGATGFVGGALVDELERRGHAIRVFVRPGRGKALAERGFEIAEGDIADAAALGRAMEGCDNVYHMAGQMLGDRTGTRQYRHVNVDGVAAVVEACRGKPLRLIHASTVGVYGMIKNPPVDETSPVSPSTPYRASKYEGETIVRRAMADGGLAAVIVRLPAMIGPRSTLWLGLIKAIAAGNFRIIGDGTNTDHITYISDAVEGLILCGETPGIEGETFVLAGADEVSVNHIVAQIARELGAPGPKGHLPRWPYALYSRLSEMSYAVLGRELPKVHNYSLFLNRKAFSIDKARQRLGYDPKIDFDEGIARTIAWSRAEGLL